MTLFDAIDWALKIFGIGGLTAFAGWWIQRKYASKNPTRQEDATVKQTEIGFVKTYNDAQFAHFQLTEKLQAMVDEKTEQLKNILIKREVEHSEQSDAYLKKIVEAEKARNEYQKKYEEEHKFSQDCLEQLRQANERIKKLEERVSELENHKR